MSQRGYQFSVGLFVITATCIAVVLTFQFGQLEKYFQERYSLVVHFDYAPGLEVGTPVQQNGITIGAVNEVKMDQKNGGVLVLVEVRQDRRLRTDTQPQLVRSLLGDSSVEFIPGSSKKFLNHGDLLKGLPPDDPFEAVQRLEKQVVETMGGFEKTSKEFASTSQEWQKVAKNLNNLMQTRQGSLDVVIERAADSLHQLTTTLNTANTTLVKANQFIADPKLQANLRKTASSIPLLVDEARSSIYAAKATMVSIQNSVTQFEKRAIPITDGTAKMITKVNGNLAQLEAVLANAQVISKFLSSEDGSLHKLAKDPQLYRNLNNSSASLSVILRNFQPILNDLQIFSDKVARHPEVLGVRGAIRSSSGLKDEGTPTSKIQKVKHNQISPTHGRPGLKTHRVGISPLGFKKEN